MNGLNIALDFLFVIGLGWGVGGVAFASLIAEWTGLALGLYLVRHAFIGSHWYNRAQIFSPKRLHKMLIVNSDIMIRSVLLQVGILSFMFWGAGFGDVTLAANQILLQLLFITSYGLDGFAFAAESLVGQAVGARAIDRLRRAVYLSGLWGAVCVIAYALAFAALGPSIITLMSNAQSVQATALEYLPWMVITPLVGVFAWILDGIFIGATRTREMRNMMVISLGIYLLAIALLLPSFGNHGLWGALLVLFGVRGITLALVYPRIERDIKAPS